MTRIVIIGGGPAGYEAALVATQLGADVTVVERDGPGGACVLSDCVPSKTFIATSEAMTTFRDAGTLGIRTDRRTGPASGGDPHGARNADIDATNADIDDFDVDAPTVYGRVRRLARAQSDDIRRRLEREGVDVISGTAGFGATQSRRTHRIEITAAGSTSDAGIRAVDAGTRAVDADVVLVATGATPRIVAGAEPDGERVLTWRQVYDLPALPEHLIVVGSGVTGAEFASAYTEMGLQVTFVCSRDRVLPGEDSDAAALLEDVFTSRGMRILKRGRASRVRRTGDGVVVDLADGRSVRGSHALMAVGSAPNTAELGLDGIGVAADTRGFLPVDRVSRTGVPGVYAAGDCTGVLMLASVAAMQGRIAMWHALGEAVTPLKLTTVSANVFTHPEIATVGAQQAAVEAGQVDARAITLPLATNPRAKMQNVTAGMVKLFCRPSTGVVVGGVVVAPSASELILPITLAVEHNLSVSQLAHTFAVYPSMSGSITEAARQLMERTTD
ncbi:MAG: NAD(P)H-quinone dehydrogenase [Mycobacteriales bacterium]